MENESRINHFLTKLRWQTSTGEFSGMTQLVLDCFHFVFPEALTDEQQYALLNFMGDAENLTTLTIDKFCNWFLANSVKFELKFKYTSERTPIHNMQSYLVIKHINKQLKERK